MSARQQQAGAVSSARKNGRTEAQNSAVVLIIKLRDSIETLTMLEKQSASDLNNYICALRVMIKQLADKFEIE